MKTDLTCFSLLCMLLCHFPADAAQELSLFDQRVQEIRAAGQEHMYMSMEDALNKAVDVLSQDRVSSFDLLNPIFGNTALMPDHSASMDGGMLKGLLVLAGTGGLLLTGATIHRIRKRKKQPW